MEMIEFSFSHYSLKLLDQIIQDKDVINKLSENDLINLSLTILPNGDTLLHLLASKS